MKKNILFLAFLVTSLGYAQVFPIDFSDPLDDMFADNCTFNLTMDAGDDVGQIIGSGQPFDNVQLTLTQNLDLSDDTNNTITFRIKPAADYGTRSHLLKFENGTAANTELSFTTTGDAWQNISIDYPAGLGNYGLLVLFTDFNNADSGTYLIDDFAGGTNVTPPPAPAAAFPLDFETTDDTFTCFGCVFNLTTDNGDNVASIGGNGELFDTAQLTLSENLDLSDDANNTITFRVKPIADYGTRTHLLKFEGGTGPITELSFTTTGTAWQNISLDFPAGLGNYDLVVYFPDFNTADVGTYLVDDFAGGTNIASIPELDIPSPTPTAPDNEVLSVYGDTGGFTNIWTSDYEFGVTTIVDTDPDPSIINNTLKMDFSVAGYGEGTNPGTVTDVSAYNFFHFDYYTTNATQIRMILIEEDGAVQEYFYELPTQEPFTFNAWQGVDIPLSFFTAQGFSLDKFFQYKIGTLSDLDTGIVYFDNLYFSVNSLSVDEFEANNTFNIFPNPTSNNWNVKATKNVNTVKVFDVLGKQVLTLEPNTRNFTINSESLNSGLYFARMNSNTGTKTIKLVKE